MHKEFKSGNLRGIDHLRDLIGREDNIKMDVRLIGCDSVK
jgi:hypothetical protein